MKWLKYLMTFLAELSVVALFFYTQHLDVGTPWLVNVSTGVLIVWIVLLGVAFIGILVVAVRMNFLEDRGVEEWTVGDKRLYDTTKYLYCDRNWFFEFLGYVTGIAMIGVLASVQWYVTMCLWLLLCELLPRSFLRECRISVTKIVAKMEKMEEGPVAGQDGR